MRLHIEEVEAALRLERDGFEEVKACLIDDLNWDRLPSRMLKRMIRRL